MPTPINYPLSDEELTAVNDRLTDIACALDDLSGEMREVYVHKLSATEFDELRAYLGTIREAQHTLCSIFYNDDRAPAIVESKQRHPSSGRVVIVDDDEHVEADQADPHGIPWYQYNRAAERLAAQLQRGVITRDEYDAATAALNAQSGMTPGGAPAKSGPEVVG